MNIGTSGPEAPTKIQKSDFYYPLNYRSETTALRNLLIASNDVMNKYILIFFIGEFWFWL